MLALGSSASKADANAVAASWPPATADAPVSSMACPAGAAFVLLVVLVAGIKSSATSVPASM